MNDEIVYKLGQEVKVFEIKNEEKAKDVLIGKIIIDSNKFDAYIINENKELINYDEYEGKIVGIIQNKKSNESKVIVSNKKSTIHYEEIKGYFKGITQFKDLKFKCLYEKSTGAVVYKKLDGVIYYLIIFSKKGVPGFPKGHIEYGESEKEAATREILEEIGVKVELDKNFRRNFFYNVDDTPINKEVVLFLAKLPEEAIIKIDRGEISDAQLFKFKDAKMKLNKDVREVLQDANTYIMEMSQK